MADAAAIYDETRTKISDLVRSLPESDLERAVPATAGWSIRDVVCHLSGDLACLIEGDFPREFFESFGDADAVTSLNRWTDGHITSRRDRSLEEVLSEWETNAKVFASMAAGERQWPDGIPGFADLVLLTDATVHLHDIYGALGREDERDAQAIRVANAGYIVAMGWRLSLAGIASLRVVAEGSDRVAGDGEPAATVRANRFEMFRALSGRRSPEQIRAFEWEGDAEPYIPYFYPYGIRHEALVE